VNKATVEIETDDPGIIVAALKPDLSPSSKFDASLNASGRKLVLTVQAADMGGLSAGLASYLRLIRAAKEASEIG
jgi:tRNA threonylcarbamoyladenosine modification (KEOPS) complex  Pcc1 subunit